MELAWNNTMETPNTRVLKEMKNTVLSNHVTP